MRSDHLVEHDTKTEDVRPRVSLKPARLLRRHIANRTKQHPGISRDWEVGSGEWGAGTSNLVSDSRFPIPDSQLPTLNSELGESEIQYLHVTVGPKHDVFRLDVAVDDPGGVRG